MDYLIEELVEYGTSTGTYIMCQHCAAEHSMREDLTIKGRYTHAARCDDCNDVMNEAEFERGCNTYQDLPDREYGTYG